LESGSGNSPPIFAQNTFALLHAIAAEGTFLRHRDRERFRRTEQKPSVLSNPTQDAVGRAAFDVRSFRGAFGSSCCALGPQPQSKKDIEP
jgi:hypothetical protein